MGPPLAATDAAVSAPASSSSVSGSLVENEGHTTAVSGNQLAPSTEVRGTSELGSSARTSPPVYSPCTQGSSRGESSCDPSLSGGAGLPSKGTSTTDQVPGSPSISLLSMLSYASSSPMLLSSQHTSSSPREGTEEPTGGGSNIPAMSDEETTSRGGRTADQEQSSPSGVGSASTRRSFVSSSSLTSSRMALPATQGSTEVSGNSRGLGGVKPGNGLVSKESCGAVHGSSLPSGDGSSSVPALPGIIPSSGGGDETSPATDAEGFLIPDPLPLPSTGSVSAGTAAAARTDQKKDEIATRGRRRSDSPQSGTAATQQTPSVPQATPTAALNGIPSSSLQALASSFATNPSSPIPPSLHTMMNNTFAAHNAAASALTSASLSPQPQPSPFQGVGGGASFPSAAAAAAALATSATLPAASPLPSSPQPSLVNVSSNLLNLAASGVVSSPSAAALLSAALARTAQGTTFPFSSPILVQKPNFTATPRSPFPTQSLPSFVPTPTSLMAAALKNAGSPAFSLQSIQQLQQTRLLAPHLDPSVMTTPQSHPSLRAGALNPNSLFPTHQAAAASHATPLGGASNLLITPSGGLIKPNTVIGAPLLSPLSAACQGLTLTAAGVHPGVAGASGGQALSQLATTTGKVEPPNRIVSPPSHTETGSIKGAVDDEKTTTTTTPAGGTTFPGEEDGVCSVCVVGECEQQNNIVFCDGCGCAVHQFCYGVVEIPEGPWYCSLCTWIRKSSRKTGSDQQQRGGSGGGHSSSQQQATSHPSGTTSTGENHNKAASASSSSSDSGAGGGEEGIEKDVALEALSITCRLCGKSGGAMRRGPEKLWVHSCCVLFCRSGPQFRKTLQLDEPVDIRASLAVARAMGWRCAICTKREGYPIPCGFRGCQNRVHVTCAREKRCVCVITSLWEGESEGVGRERVWKAVFCPSHNDLRSIELAKQFEREKLFSHSLPPGGGGGTAGAPAASPPTTRSTGSFTTTTAEAMRLHLMQNGPGVLQPEKADGGIHSLFSRGDDTAAASAISALGAQTLAATSSHAAAADTSARRFLSVTPRPPATPSSKTLAGFSGGQQQGIGLTLIPQPGRLLGSGDDAVTRAGTLASSLRLGTPSTSPFGPFFAHPQCGGGAASSLTADALQKQLLQQARVLSAKTTAALSLEQLGGGAATTPAGGAATSAARLAGPTTCLAGVFTPGGETTAGSGNAGILAAGGVGVASQPGTAAFIQPHAASVQTAAVLNGAGLSFFSPHQLSGGQQQAVVAGGGKTTTCGGIGSVLTSSPLSSQQSSFELSTNTSSSVHASSHSVDSNTASAVLASSGLKPPDCKAAPSTVVTPALSDTGVSAKTLSHPSNLPSTLLGSTRSGSGPAPPSSESDVVTTGVNASSPPAPSSSSTSLPPSSPLPALRAGSKRGGRGRLHRPVVLSSYKNRHSSSVPASSVTASSAANRLGAGPPLGGGGTGPGGGGAPSGTVGGGVRGGMSGVSGGDLPDGADITGTAAGTQVHAAATRGSRVHWGRFDALFRRVAVGPFADSVLETFKTSQERRVAVEEARAIESILGAPPVCPDSKALFHPPLEDQEVVESLLEMYVKEVEAAVKKSRELKRTRMRMPSKEKKQKEMQPEEEIGGGDISGGSSRSDKSEGKNEAQQQEKNAEISNGIVQTAERLDSEPVHLKQSRTLSGSRGQKEESSGQEEENICSNGDQLSSPSASAPVPSGSCGTVEISGSSDDRNDNVPSSSLSDTPSTSQDVQQKTKPVVLAGNVVSSHEEEKQEGGKKSSSDSCQLNIDNIMVDQEEEDEKETEEDISLPLTALVDFGPIAAWLLFEAIPTDGHASDYQEEQAVIEQFCNSGLSFFPLSQSTSSSKSKGHTTTTTGLPMADSFTGGKGGGTGSSSVLSFSSTHRLHAATTVGSSISPTNPHGTASSVSSGSSVSSRGGAAQPGSGIQLRISPYSHMTISGAGGSGRRTSASSSSVGGGGGGVSSGLVQEYVSRVVNPGYHTEGGAVAPSHSSDHHRDTSVKTTVERDKHQRNHQRNSSSTSDRPHVGRGTRERVELTTSLTTTEEDTSLSSTSPSPSVVKKRRCRLTVKAFKILTFYQLTYCRRRLQQVLLRPEKHPLYQQALKAEKQQRARRDQLAKLGEFEEEEARVLPLIKLCSLLSERGIDASLVEKEVVQHAKVIADSSSAAFSSSSATTTSAGAVDTAKVTGGEVGKTREGHSSSLSGGNDGASTAGSIPGQAVGGQTSLNSNNNNIHQVDGIMSGEKNGSSELMSTTWPNGSVSSNSNTPVSRQQKKSLVDPSLDMGGGIHASPSIPMALFNSTSPSLGVQLTTTTGVEGPAQSSLVEQLFPGSSRSLKKQRVGESTQPSMMSSSSSGSVSVGETSSTETFSTQQQSIVMRITAPAGGGDGTLGGGEQSKHAVSVGVGYRTGTLPSFEAGVGPGGTGENGASVVMVGGHRWYIRPWGWEGSPYADLVGGEDDFVGIQCAQFLQVSSVLSQDLRRLKFHLLQSVLEENRQPLKIVDRPQSSDHLLARYASMHRWSQLRQHVCEGVKDILPPPPVAPPPSPPPVPSSSSSVTAGGVPSSSSSQPTGVESGTDGSSDLPSFSGVEGRCHHSSEAERSPGGDTIRTQNVEGETRRSVNTSTNLQTEDSCSPSSSKHRDKHLSECSSSSLTSGRNAEEGVGGVPSSEKKNSQGMTGGTSSTGTDQGSSSSSSSTSSAGYGGGEILTPPVRLLDSCIPPEKQKESYSQRRQLYESKALQVSSATDANVCALLLQQQQKLQHQLGCLTDPVASVAGAAGWGLGSMGVATSTASEVERRLLLVLSSSPASPSQRPNTTSYHDDLVTKDEGGGDLGESPASSSASPSLKRSGEEISGAEADHHHDDTRQNNGDDCSPIPTTAISKSSCAVFSSPSSATSGTSGTGGVTTMIARGETTARREGDARIQHHNTSCGDRNLHVYPLRNGEESQRDVKSYPHHHSEGGGGMKGGGGMDNFELSVSAFLAHGEEEEKRFREKKQPVLMAPGVINPQGPGGTPSSQQNPISSSSSSPVVSPPYSSSTSVSQACSTSVPCNSSPSHPWRKDKLRGGHSSSTSNGNKSLSNAPPSHHVTPDNLPVLVERGGEEQQQHSKEDSRERKRGQEDLSKRGEQEKEAAPVSRSNDTNTSTSCCERNEKNEKGEVRIVTVENECEGGKEEQGEKTTEETNQQDKISSGISKREKTTGGATEKSSEGEDKEQSQEEEVEKNDERKCQDGGTNSSPTTPSIPPVTSTAGEAWADLPLSSSSSQTRSSVDKDADVCASSQQEKEEDVDPCKDQEGKRRTAMATSHHTDTTAILPATPHTMISDTSSNDKDAPLQSTQEHESPSPDKAVPSLMSKGDAREGGDDSLVQNHVASEAQRDRHSNSSSRTSTSLSVSSTIPPPSASASPQLSPALVDGTEIGEGSVARQEGQVAQATTAREDPIPPSSHSLISSPTPPVFHSSSKGGTRGAVGATGTSPSVTSPRHVTQTSATTTTATPSSGGSGGAGLHSHHSQQHHHQPSMIPVPATTVGTGAGNHSGTGIGGILDGITPGGGGAGGTTGGGLCNCCCVCWLSERSHLNPILSCLRCLVTVHKNCYGVGKTGETIEGDDWICRRCEFEKKGLGTQWMVIFEPMKIQCQICGLGGGALKPTVVGTWVHVFCSLWLVPEATCLDYSTLEPWNLDGVAQWRKDARCRLCDQEVGYCVRCAEVGCEVCFHPMCAWLSGLSCEAESLRGLFLSFRGSVDRCFPRLVVRAYCYKHSPEFLADGRRRSSAVQGSLRRRRYVTRDHRPDLFSANDRRSGGLLFKRGPGGNRRGTSGGNTSGAVGGGQARGRASSSSSSSSLFSASPGPTTTTVVGLYPGVCTPQIPALPPPPSSTPGGKIGGGSGSASLSSRENHIETGGGGGHHHARTTSVITGGETTGVREGASIKEAANTGHSSSSRSRNHSNHTSLSASLSPGGCASGPSSSASSSKMDAHHDHGNVKGGDGKLSSSSIEDRNQSRSDTNKKTMSSSSSSSGEGDTTSSSSSTSQGEGKMNETEKTSTVGTPGAAPSSTIVTTSDDPKAPHIVANTCGVEGGEGCTSSGSSRCCSHDRKGDEDHHDDSGDDQIHLAEGEGQVMDDEELSAILQGEENVILEECDLYEDHCCAVCLLPRVTCTTTNPFFHCERCGLCVHRQCYGIKKEDLPLHLRPDLLKKFKPNPRSATAAIQSSMDHQSNQSRHYRGEERTPTPASRRPTTPALSLTGEGEKIHPENEKEGKRQPEQDTPAFSDEKNKREGRRGGHVGSERKDSLDVDMSSPSPGRLHDHASTAKENEKNHVSSSSSVTERGVEECSSSSSSFQGGSPSHRPDRTPTSGALDAVHDDLASVKKRKRELLPLQPHHRRTVEDRHSEAKVMPQGDPFSRKEEEREEDLRSHEDEDGERVSKRQALVKHGSTEIEDRKKITTVGTGPEVGKDVRTEEISSVSKEVGAGEEDENAKDKGHPVRYQSASVQGGEERDEGRLEKRGEESSTTTTTIISPATSATAGGGENGLKAKKGAASPSKENVKMHQQDEEGEEASPPHTVSPLTPAALSTAGGEGGEGMMGEKDLDYKPKPFLCEACTWLPPREKPFCLLCPRRGGAFKLVIPSVPPYILPSPTSPTSHHLNTTSTTTASGLPSSSSSSSHSQSSHTRGSPSHHHHASSGGGVHTQQQQSQYPSPYLRPSFAHMTCCLWAPGVDVAATPALSPIVGVDRVLRQQRQLLLQHQRRKGKLVRGLPTSNTSSTHMEQPPFQNSKETSLTSSLDSQQRSSVERGGDRDMCLREESSTKIENPSGEGDNDASSSCSRDHPNGNVKVSEARDVDMENENYARNTDEQQQANWCKLVAQGEFSKKKKGEEGVSRNQTSEISFQKDRESREEAPEGHHDRSPSVKKGVDETANSAQQDEMNNLDVKDAGQNKDEVGREGVGKREMKEKNRREGEEEREELMVASPLPNSSSRHDRMGDLQRRDEDHKQLSVIERNGQDGREMREAREKTGDHPPTKNRPNVLLWGECEVCGLSYGYCMKCSQKGCKQFFHPLCVQLKGGFMEMTEQPGRKFTAVAFCMAHSFVRNQISPSVRLFLRLRSFLELSRLLVGQVSRRERAKRVWLKKRRELLDAEFPLTFTPPVSLQVSSRARGPYALEKALNSSEGSDSLSATLPTTAPETLTKHDTKDNREEEKMRSSRKELKTTPIMEASLGGERDVEKSSPCSRGSDDVSKNVPSTEERRDVIVKTTSSSSSTATPGKLVLPLKSKSKMSTSAGLVDQSMEDASLLAKLDVGNAMAAAREAAARALRQQHALTRGEEETRGRGGGEQEVSCSHRGEGKDVGSLRRKAAGNPGLSLFTSSAASQPQEERDSSEGEKTWKKGSPVDISSERAIVAGGGGSPISSSSSGRYQKTAGDRSSKQQAPNDGRLKEGDVVRDKSETESSTLRQTSSSTVMTSSQAKKQEEERNHARKSGSDSREGEDVYSSTTRSNKGSTSSPSSTSGVQHASSLPVSSKDRHVVIIDPNNDKEEERQRGEGGVVDIDRNRSSPSASSSSPTTLAKTPDKRESFPESLDPLKPSEGRKGNTEALLPEHFHPSPASSGMDNSTQSAHRRSATGVGASKIEGCGVGKGTGGGGLLKGSGREECLLEGTKKSEEGEHSSSSGNGERDDLPYIDEKTGFRCTKLSEEELREVLLLAAEQQHHPLGGGAVWGGASEGKSHSVGGGGVIIKKGRPSNRHRLLVLLNEGSLHSRKEAIQIAVHMKKTWEDILLPGVTMKGTSTPLGQGGENHDLSNKQRHSLQSHTPSTIIRKGKALPLVYTVPSTPASPTHVSQLQTSSSSPVFLPKGFQNSHRIPPLESPHLKDHSVISSSPVHHPHPHKRQRPGTTATKNTPPLASHDSSSSSHIISSTSAGGTGSGDTETNKTSRSSLSSSPGGGGTKPSSLHSQEGAVGKSPRMASTAHRYHQGTKNSHHGSMTTGSAREEEEERGSRSSCGGASSVASLISSSPSVLLSARLIETSIEDEQIGMTSSSHSEAEDVIKMKKKDDTGSLSSSNAEMEEGVASKRLKRSVVSVADRGVLGGGEEDEDIKKIKKGRSDGGQGTSTRCTPLSTCASRKAMLKEDKEEEKEELARREGVIVEEIGCSDGETEKRSHHPGRDHQESEDPQNEFTADTADTKTTKEKKKNSSLLSSSSIMISLRTSVGEDSSALLEGGRGAVKKNDNRESGEDGVIPKTPEEILEKYLPLFVSVASSSPSFTATHLKHVSCGVAEGNGRVHIQEKEEEGEERGEKRRTSSCMEMKKSKKDLQEGRWSQYIISLLLELLPVDTLQSSLKGGGTGRHTVTTVALIPKNVVNKDEVLRKKHQQKLNVLILVYMHRLKFSFKVTDEKERSPQGMANACQTHVSTGGEKGGRGGPSIGRSSRESHSSSSSEGSVAIELSRYVRELSCITPFLSPFLGNNASSNALSSTPQSQSTTSTKAGGRQGLHTRSARASSSSSETTMISGEGGEGMNSVVISGQTGSGRDNTSVLECIYTRARRCEYPSWKAFVDEMTGKLLSSYSKPGGEGRSSSSRRRSISRSTGGGGAGEGAEEESTCEIVLGTSSENHRRERKEKGVGGGVSGEKEAGGDASYETRSTLLKHMKAWGSLVEIALSDSQQSSSPEREEEDEEQEENNSSVTSPSSTSVGTTMEGKQGGHNGVEKLREEGGGTTKEESKKNDGLLKQMKKSEGRKGWSSGLKLSDWLESLNVEKWPSVEGYDASLPSPWVQETVPPKGLDAIGRRVALYSAQMQVWLSGVVIYYGNRESSTSASHHHHHVADRLAPGHNKEGGGDHHVAAREGQVTERKRGREENSKRLRGESSSSSSSTERDNTRAFVSGERNLKSSHSTSKRGGQHNHKVFSPHDEMNHRGGGGEKKVEGCGAETGDMEKTTGPLSQEKDVGPQGRKKEDEKPKKRGRKGSTQEEVSSLGGKLCCMTVGGDRYLIAFDDDDESCHHSAWVDFSGVTDIVLFDNSPLSSSSSTVKGEGDKRATLQNWMEAYRRRVSKRQQQVIDEHLSSSSSSNSGSGSTRVVKKTTHSPTPPTIVSDDQPPSGDSHNTSRGREVS
ncbi:phd-finger domain-containing protein [Cystoisospora suis]|uniref:Phd-finger domain-containing protein n=1 Tax=Cystoisospora suis TaxID=483139 RepID=A0A2C6KMC4_9APIC|nr:phd-finger domain-containing protein [Cystoisospora suis]